MPQMNPLLWLPLFCSFILILILTNALNFFNKNYSTQNSGILTKSSISIIWKW